MFTEWVFISINELSLALICLNVELNLLPTSPCLWCYDTNSFGLGWTIISRIMYYWHTRCSYSTSWLSHCGEAKNVNSSPFHFFALINFPALHILLTFQIPTFKTVNCFIFIFGCVLALIASILHTPRPFKVCRRLGLLFFSFLW